MHLFINKIIVMSKFFRFYNPGKITLEGIGDKSGIEDYALNHC